MTLARAAPNWYNQLVLVSESVHDRLAGDVLSGRLAPGDALPSERVLSEELGVNRHAIREAIKRLQQAGLVRVSQGGATRVLDWRATAGLDLLVALAELQPELLHDIVEMRAAIGADVARLAAERARPRLEPAGDAESYIAFWAQIVEAADNLAYRLAFNSLVAAPIDQGIYAAEYEDAPAQAALAAAIAEGDGAGAETLARTLLRRTVEAA